MRIPEAKAIPKTPEAKARLKTPGKVAMLKQRVTPGELSLMLKKWPRKEAMRVVYLKKHGLLPRWPFVPRHLRVGEGEKPRCWNDL